MTYVFDSRVSSNVRTATSSAETKPTGSTRWLLRRRRELRVDPFRLPGRVGHDDLPPGAGVLRPGDPLPVRAHDEPAGRAAAVVDPEVGVEELDGGSGLVGRVVDRHADPAVEVGGEGVVDVRQVDRAVGRDQAGSVDVDERDRGLRDHLGVARVHLDGAADPSRGVGVGLGLGDCVAGGTTLRWLDPVIVRPTGTAMARAAATATPATAARRRWMRRARPRTSVTVRGACWIGSTLRCRASWTWSSRGVLLIVRLRSRGG